MKIFTSTLIFVFFLVVSSVAQPSKLNKNITLLPANLQRKVKSDLRTVTTTNTVSCGKDTVLYPYAKATGATVLKLVGNGQGKYGEGLGQWYDAPQPITIYGFQFFGRTIAAGSTANVNVSVYSSKADSTPNAKLATTTTTLNNTELDLSSMLRTVNFTTPITVTGPYLVVVEAPSTGTDTIQLATNADGNGYGEALSKVRIAGTQWYDVGDAYGLDADFLAFPIVTYNLSAKYTVSGNLVPGGTVNFTNTSSPIMEDIFYNTDLFQFNIGYYTWDFGDGKKGVSQVKKDTSHVYAAAGNYTVKLSDTLSGYSIGCASDTSSVVKISSSLPIKLVSFEARRQANKAVITWSTDNEINSDHYEVERSTDGITYQTYAKVKSNDRLGATQNYTITDESPQSINYYRLVQYDRDGRKTLFGVRVVNFTAGAFSLQIYPNPATNSFILRTQSGNNNNGIANIADASGRVVKMIRLDASGVQTVVATDLSDGNYFINVNVNGVTTTEKLIIKKK